MRLVLGLAVLAGGCLVEHHSDPQPEPQPAVQPHACSNDITLDGSQSPAPTQLPLVLDTNGTSICLHLDATKNLVAAHFAAQTDYQPGAASAFAFTLEDASFAAVQDGWDVTVDNRSFANLEWNAPLHAMTDAVLWVRANAATTPTTVSLSLFEPYE